MEKKFWIFSQKCLEILDNLLQKFLNLCIRNISKFCKLKFTKIHFFFGVWICLEMGFFEDFAIDMFAEKVVG